MAVKGRGSGRALRAALRSPGRPPVARRADLARLEGGDRGGSHERGRGAGGGLVSSRGARWFRRLGGLPPTHLSVSARPLSGRTLSFAEREEVAWLARPGARRARGRPPARPCPVDHLA